MLLNLSLKKIELQSTFQVEYFKLRDQRGNKGEMRINHAFGAITVETPDEETRPNRFEYLVNLFYCTCIKNRRFRLDGNIPGLHRPRYEYLGKNVRVSDTIKTSPENYHVLINDFTTDKSLLYELLENYDYDAFNAEEPKMRILTLLKRSYDIMIKYKGQKFDEIQLPVPYKFSQLEVGIYYKFINKIMDDMFSTISTYHNPNTNKITVLTPPCEKRNISSV